MNIKNLLPRISTKKLSYQQYAVFFSILAVLLVRYLLPGPAHAAALTEASIRLDRMGAGIAANSTDAKILVVVEPATTATEAKLKITWPDSTVNGFTVDGTAANHTTSTTGLPSTYNGVTLNAWPSIQSTATSVTDNGNTTDVVYTSGDLTVGQLYGFWITGGITNPPSGHQGQQNVILTTEDSTPATIDSSTVAVYTVDTNSDQVTVTASVDPTFSFNLNSNSIALGTLSTTARTTGNVTASASTNANNGWIAWMRSEGAAATLASASTGDSISSTKTGSCVTATIGSKGYVVNVASSNGTGGTGSLTVSSEYGCTAGQAGGVLATTYDQIASRNGVVSGDTLTLNAIVTISAVTKPATDYTDTWEVVGAGEF